MFYEQLKEFTSKGPFDQGSEILNHKGKRTRTTLNSSTYEDYVSDLSNKDYSLWTIPQGYESRADAIAFKFYGDPSLFWVILESNNILDPFEELNVGSKIRIPRL